MSAPDPLDILLDPTFVPELAALADDTTDDADPEEMPHAG